jgi:hypothetical protein
VLPKHVASYLADPVIKHAEYIGGWLGALAWVQVLAVDLPSGAWGVFQKDIKQYVKTHPIDIHL